MPFKPTHIIGSLALLATVLLGSNAFAAAPQKIGVVGGLHGTVTAVLADSQEVVSLKLGDDIYLDQTITTGADATAQLMFLDKSSLTVVPSTVVKVDKFVFNPADASGQLAMESAKGTFRFIGGALSKNNPVTIKTPVSTIGIRGGIVQVSTAADGKKSDAIFFYGHEMTVQVGSGAPTSTTEFGRGVSVSGGKTEVMKPEDVDAKVSGFNSEVKSGSNSEDKAASTPAASDSKSSSTSSSSEGKKDENASTSSSTVKDESSSKKDDKATTTSTSSGTGGSGSDNGGGSTASTGSSDTKASPSGTGKTTTTTTTTNRTDALPSTVKLTGTPTSTPTSTATTNTVQASASSSASSAEALRAAALAKAAEAAAAEAAALAKAAAEAAAIAKLVDAENTTYSKAAEQNAERARAMRKELTSKWGEAGEVAYEIYTQDSKMTSDELAVRLIQKGILASSDDAAAANILVTASEANDYTTYGKSGVKQLKPQQQQQQQEVQIQQQQQYDNSYASADPVYLQGVPIYSGLLSSLLPDQDFGTVEYTGVTNANVKLYGKSTLETGYFKARIDTNNRKLTDLQINLESLTLWASDDTSNLGSITLVGSSSNGGYLIGSAQSSLVGGKGEVLLGTYTVSNESLIGVNEEVLPTNDSLENSNSHVVGTFIGGSPTQVKVPSAEQQAKWGAWADEAFLIQAENTKIPAQDLMQKAVGRELLTADMNKLPAEKFANYGVVEYSGSTVGTTQIFNGATENATGRFNAQIDFSNRQLTSLQMTLGQIAMNNTGSTSNLGNVGLTGGAMTDKGLVQLRGGAELGLYGDAAEILAGKFNAANEAMGTSAQGVLVGGSH